MLTNLTQIRKYCFRAIAAALLVAGGDAVSSQALAASPDPFGIAVPVSVGISNFNGSVAIDNTGNAVASWELTPVQVAHQFASGSWTAPQSIVGPAGISENSIVRYNAAGVATAVWFDNFYDGIWTADMSVSGVWSNPVRLAVAASQTPANVLENVRFAMNASGDAVIFYETNILTNSHAPSLLMAIRRSAGKPWNAPEVVHTGTVGILDGSAESAVINSNGDIMVAVDESTAVVKNSRGVLIYTDYDLHVVTALKNSANWQDVLVVPHTTLRTVVSNSGHGAHMAVDPLGRVAMAYWAAVNGTLVDTIQAVVLQASGTAWSAPATVFTTTAPAGLAVVGLGVDSFGNLSLATSNASIAQVQTGNVASNSWTAPVLISGFDAYSSSPVFAAGPNGAAAVAWTEADSSRLYATFKVAYRSAIGGAWSAAQTVSPTNVVFSSLDSSTADGVAINDVGKAIVIFHGAVTSTQAAGVASANTMYVSRN